MLHFLHHCFSLLPFSLSLKINKLLVKEKIRSTSFNKFQIIIIQTMFYNHSVITSGMNNENITKEKAIPLDI